MFKFLLVSSLISTSFFACKSADRKDNNAALQSNGANEIPCPIGQGVNAATGGFMGCECPSSHPHFNADTGMCSKQAIADVSCERSDAILAFDGIGVKKLNLNASVSNNKLTGVEGSGTASKSSVDTPFNVALTKIDRVALGSSELTIYMVSGSGAIQVNKGQSSSPIRSMALSVGGAMVTIFTKDNQKYVAHGCSFNPDFVNILDKNAP